MPPPAPSATPWRARVAMAAIGVLVVALVTSGTLPPWWAKARHWLLVVVGVAIAGLLVASLAGRSRRAPAAGIRLAPRERLVVLSTLLTLAGSVVLGLVGKDVVAAHTLPSSPEQVSVLRTYHPCLTRSGPSKVVFDAGGARVDTAYPGSLFALPDDGAGATFAYDPSAPTRVMPLRDFRFGRGLGLTYGVSALALLLAWYAGVALNSLARSRAGLAALASEEIVDAGMPRGARREVTFASGARHTFVQTPELDAALRSR